MTPLSVRVRTSSEPQNTMAADWLIVGHFQDSPPPPLDPLFAKLRESGDIAG